MENEKVAIGKKLIYKSPIRSLFDKFAQQKDVSLVYGEPIELEDKQVLPVAKVNYYVGGGGGYAGSDGIESVGQGEGGGGYFSIKPLGVYEITSEKVRFKPIIDLKFIFTLSAVLTFGMTLLLKKSQVKRS